MPFNLEQFKKQMRILAQKRNFSKKLQTKEKKNLAANKYVSAWQKDKLFNNELPDFIDSTVPTKLTLSVTLGKEMEIFLDYALIKTLEMRS